MSTWAQRAKAHFSQERQNATAETAERVCDFSQERQNATAETAETPLLAVSAVTSGRFYKKHEIETRCELAANDPQKGELIDIGTVRPPGLSPALMAASLALDAQIQAQGLPGNDPDSWSYPHSTAMNTAELDLFAARLTRFTTKGVSHGDAEALADKLVHRDRERDDRRLCLECSHLGGYGRVSWRCGNWLARLTLTCPTSIAVTTSGVASSTTFLAWR